MAQDLTSLLATAFATRPDLKTATNQALAQHPEQQSLFADICSYIISLSSQQNGVSHGSDEPPSKKRRLEDCSSVKVEQDDAPRTTMLEAKDISFTLPQRKKFHLRILQSGSAGSQTAFIQAVNPTSGSVEFEHSLSSYAYAMRLPVPEKQQKQYNFCLIPKSQESSAEPILWTVNHGPLKSCTIEDPALQNVAQGPEDILENALRYILARTDVELTFPSENEFASAVREAHRKNDIAYHVKAHRGSKEGYLFFLSNGIFFGFKKPLVFFPFNEIESISYTSVLQRTFNLNITVRPDQEAETQEIEFSMIDQQDFSGIDTYIKSHQLQDASLAEARRAKKVGKEVKAETSDTVDDDGQTELEKAQQELEDKEDEMEEDYDPEEEDDDGSGSESDSGDEAYTKGKGTNLIADELGSEAEDVSASEDEAEDGAAPDDEEEEDAEGEDEPDVEVEVRPVKELAKPKQQLPSHSGRQTDMMAYDDDDQL